MKFLADQDVYAASVRFLQKLGHDVVTASELDLWSADDTTLLRKARQLGRILVTRDRDFGGLVFVEGMGPGVLYLRMLPSTQTTVHQELARVLDSHSESELKGAFVVIGPGRHRIRRLSMVK